MMVNERQRRILEELEKKPDITVRELAKLLYVSEPTIRRDFTELDSKGIITKIYGGAILHQGAADREIPFFFRQQEKSAVKSQMGAKAASLVKDGMVVMLDGSTSAFHLVPYLVQRKDLIVVTSGAKTAVALAEANIRTFCTGGQMLIHSFSYVGEQAESFVRNINADILFFSCRGLSLDGMLSDPSIDEANLRQTMFEKSKKKYLLCDSSKFGQVYFYNMGNVSDLDDVLSDAELPDSIASKIGTKK
jgi:DeoR/GlpR family transcriptional regulator of sugar metabolism